MTGLYSTIKNPPGDASSALALHDYMPFEHDSAYTVFAKARREQPIFYCPSINYWVVSKYSDIKRIFTDHKTFVASNTLAPVFDINSAVHEILSPDVYAPEPVQSNCLPPKHTRIRRAVLKILNREYFHSLIPSIEQIVEEYCDRIAKREDCDLASEFAYDIPALIMMRIQGICSSRLADVKRWARDRHLFSLGALPSDQQPAVARSMLEYWQFCCEIVHDRVVYPRDDYASKLLAIRAGNDDILTLNEIRSLVFSLLLAGHETTANMMLNMVVATQSHPHLWATLRGQTDLQQKVVEECLRVNSSVIAWRRQTSRECRIGGVVLPEGANVLLAIASGNCDEEVFPNPAEIDIHRENLRGHLSFGLGIHKCIGEELARIELRIVLNKLTQRFPNMSIMQPGETVYTPLLTFRGPTSLTVRLRGDL